MVEESKEAVDLFDQSYLETAWEWKCSKSNIEYPTNWEGETAEGNTYAKECAEIENSDWQRKWKVDCSEFKLQINADSTFCASMQVFDYDKPGPDAVEGSLKVSGTYVRQGQIIVCDVKERNQTGSQDLQHLKEWGFMQDKLILRIHCKQRLLYKGPLLGAENPDHPGMLYIMEHDNSNSDEDDESEGEEIPDSDSDEE